MSRGSEYAAALGNLYQLQAQNISERNRAQAEARMAKSQIWGGTLANLGQAVMNLPQAMRERKIAGLKEQELLAGFEDKRLAREAMGRIQQIIAREGGINERSVPQVAAIDPKVGETFQKILDDADARVKAKRDRGIADNKIRIDILAGTDPTNAQSRVLGKTLYQRAFPDEDASVFDDVEQLTGFVKAANNASLSSDKRYDIAHPKPNLMAAAPGTTLIDQNNPQAPRIKIPYEMNPDQIADNARMAAQQAETERHNRAMEARPVAGAITNTDDVKETVLGMIDGTLPPVLPGRATKEYNALMAEAHRQGFDLASASTDWLATQKHIATMNGAQQLRLNQAINSLPEMLDRVDVLAGQWKGGRFPPLNKGNLAAAKAGAFGNDVASVANQLDAQIADIVADLGNVYMGGNSPTDHALQLAGKSLSADWSEKVLKDMVALARANVQIRRNSINNTGVQGASPNNPYAPTPPPTTEAPSGAGSAWERYQRLSGGR